MTNLNITVPSWLARLWPILASALLIGMFVATRESRLMAVERTVITLAHSDSLRGAEIAAIRELTRSLRRRQCLVYLTLLEESTTPLGPVFEAEASVCRGEITE